MSMSADQMKAELEKLKKDNAAKAEKYQERTDDVAGYWVPEKCSILGKPLHVKLFDSQLDEEKPSMLISVVLTSPTIIESGKKEDKKERIAKAGEVVGVWYKPGMRAIRECAGVETYLELTNKTKPMKKGNPMKVYLVKSEGGTLIPIAEDARVHSASRATPFDTKQTAKGAKKGPAGPTNDDDADEDDDTPF